MNSPEMREWVEGADAALREAVEAANAAQVHLSEVRVRHRQVADAAWADEGEVWLAAQRAERPAAPGEVEEVYYTYSKPVARWLARIESRTPNGGLRLIGPYTKLNTAGSTERRETISSNVREYKCWCERFGVNPNPRRW